MIHETTLRREMRRILQAVTSNVSKAKQLLRVAHRARQRGEQLALLAFHSKLRGQMDRYERFERAAKRLLSVADEARLSARYALGGPSLGFETTRTAGTVRGWQAPQTGWRPGE